MSCSWLYLASLTTPERFCDEPGHPYCAEHQAEMAYIHSLDEDWKEVEATHKAVCEEPRGRATKAQLSPKPL
jgi:hypothetical protein